MTNIATLADRYAAPPMDLSRIETIHPRSYNDARRIGEHYREGVPVIMNLSELDDPDAKRIIDFAAGLVFGMRGSVEYKLRQPDGSIVMPTFMHCNDRQHSVAFLGAPMEKRINHLMIEVENMDDVGYTLDIVRKRGIAALAEQYLGERPAISVEKTVFRRVPPDTLGGWHQDGAFLGEGIHSLNLWIAVTDCGAEAPTMEFVATLKQIAKELGDKVEAAAIAWESGSG